MHGRGRTLHKRPPQSLQISLWISALWRFVALSTSAFRKRNPKRGAILPYQLSAPTKEQVGGVELCTSALRSLCRFPCGFRRFGVLLRSRRAHFASETQNAVRFFPTNYPHQQRSRWRGRTLHKRPPQSLQIFLWILALWRFVALLTSAFRKRNPKRSAILSDLLPAPTKEQVGVCPPAPLLVRVTGVEPARQRHKILNLARLPIPPYPHMGRRPPVVSWEHGRPFFVFRYGKIILCLPSAPWRAGSRKWPLPPDVPPKSAPCSPSGVLQAPLGSSRG